MFDDKKRKKDELYINYVTGEIESTYKDDLLIDRFGNIKQQIGKGLVMDLESGEIQYSVPLDKPDK
ncbi:MAG: hypothetical protein J6W93_05995 [Clostridia bacterium]|nr:hypothetical protein [Clostridia bacterium]